jgi:hypothetical protein
MTLRINPGAAWLAVALFVTPVAGRAQTIEGVPLV